MPFPETNRVIYEKNPLDQVICQLRFPTVLRIDTEPPAKFQDMIRNQYPNFREVQPSIPELPKEIVKILGSESPFRIGNAVYEFVSADELWKISLSRDFIALTAFKYKKWEDFKEHFKKPIEALVDIYKPSFYTRIGLRYRDVIQRSKLDLTNMKWSDLLKTHIAGELSTPDVMENIMHRACDVLICLREHSGLVHLQHGLGKDSESNEPVYIIDSDFYTDNKTEIANAAQILDYFNKQAARLFRWCISERLHNAMDPRPI